MDAYTEYDIGLFFLSYQAVNCPQALEVQRASRSLELQQVARGGGAPAQLSLPRNPPSASPQIHLRYLQQSKNDTMLWMLVMLILYASIF